MAFARYSGGLADRLPVIGRLRRQRESARAEARRLLGMLNEVLRRDRGFIAERLELTLLLDPGSTVDRHALNGDWESGLIAGMAAAARSFAGDPRRKLFLDVGAHWGLYALSMRRLGLFDEIHCFEPEPHNRAQLGAQLFLNRAAYDIVVHGLAALDRAGTVRMQPAVAIGDGNRGSAAIVAEGGIAVPAMALDDVITADGAVLFVKMDVERSEARALDGMRRLLATNEVYLQVEVFPGGEAAFEAAMPGHLVLRHVDEANRVYSTFPLPAGRDPA